MRNKILVGIVVLVMLLSTASVVSATSHEQNSRYESFRESWYHTPINDANRTFKYGYNTRAINEDYCHTYHKNKRHHAYVKNTNRASDVVKAAGKYAKAEIAHRGGGTVYYKFTY